MSMPDEDREEFLAFYRLEGKGVPMRRLARLFDTTEAEIARWQEDPQFAAAMRSAEAEWPAEDPQVPYTRRLDMWLSALEELEGDRQAACKKAKISWPRVAAALENNPAFRKCVQWTIDLRIKKIEDRYLEEALDSTRVARHVLASHDPKYASKSSVRVEGKVDHGHTVALGDGTQQWLEERLALPDVVDAEYIEN